MTVELTKALDVHLNLNVRGRALSATMAIKDRCRQRQADGMDVFDMGLGQSPFPVPQCVVEELRSNAHQKDYLPVAGLPELRKSVAEYHCRDQGLNCVGNDVLIGPGSKELMFLLQLSYYGNLMIPRPSWVSYAPQAHILGRNVLWLRTKKEENWKLTPDRLDEACRQDPGQPRILILNYPANPTGCTYDQDELKALAEVAANYRIVLLSDEIYGELHHRGEHLSIARYYPQGTIISSGLSKWCGAGGWRLGTFTFPNELYWLRDSMTAIASETFTSTSAPIQYAAVRAFQQETEIENYICQSRRILGAIGRYLAERLNEAGIFVPQPDGGFYLFLDFSKFRDSLAVRRIVNSPQLCESLLEEKGVALLPGASFGRLTKELTARLAYVDFDGASALSSAQNNWSDRPLDEEFIRQNCARVIHACDGIIEWLL